ncbi:MAG: hypothetical protein ACHQFW_02635 [Chitinophagales bacterium]
MSKRKAKLRIRNKIAEAIENLMVQSDIDDKAFDKKADELFILYDDSMSKINGVRKIGERAGKKKHFKDLDANVNETISKIINGK